MTKEITQDEISFIKKRYPSLQIAAVEEPNRDEQTIIMSRSLDATKVRISRRRLNHVPSFSFDTKCAYCGRKVYERDSCEALNDPRSVRTRDHLIPKCDGGIEAITACHDCNNIRGSDPVEVFVAFMDTKPQILGRERSYRFFKRDLMLEALHARNAGTAIGFEFAPRPRSRYMLKDLKRDCGA
jgi:hypothetical protein